MLKALELTDKASCFNRAKQDEPVFVLLGRDPVANAVIRHWVAERVALGLNTREDKQVREALLIGADMLDYYQRLDRKGGA